MGRDDGRCSRITDDGRDSSRCRHSVQVFIFFFNVRDVSSSFEAVGGRLGDWRTGGDKYNKSHAHTSSLEH